MLKEQHLAENESVVDMATVFLCIMNNIKVDWDIVIQGTDFEHWIHFYHFCAYVMMQMDDIAYVQVFIWNVVK